MVPHMEILMVNYFGGEVKLEVVVRVGSRDDIISVKDVKYGSGLRIYDSEY